MKTQNVVKKNSLPKLKGKADQPLPSVVDKEAAVGKSAFWSSPKEKISTVAKKSLKPKRKVKTKEDKNTAKPASMGSNANRAERRRVKKERMKPSIPSQ